jgi:antitoxin FitA
MVALQIRDVPEDVRDTLVDRARSRGQSLQAFLLSLVEAEARRSKNRAVLARFAGRSDGSRVSADETADELRGLREERDRELGDC